MERQTRLAVVRSACLSRSTPFQLFQHVFRLLRQSEVRCQSEEGGTLDFKAGQAQPSFADAEGASFVFKEAPERHWNTTFVLCLQKRLRIQQANPWSVLV